MKAIHKIAPIYHILLILALSLTLIKCNQKDTLALTKWDSLKFENSAKYGVQSSEALNRCDRYMRAWLEYSDPQTGLIPRNLDNDRDIWNGKDAAADNYPFMILTSWFTSEELFMHRMHEMLNTERNLTSRIGNLPDTWSFSKQDFHYPEIDSERIIFGASEYVKDGLLPVTEWLGPSPWSERMIELLDGIQDHIDVFQELPNNKIGQASTEEVNGELLQALSRVYWITGDDMYLNWAIKIGDNYLLSDNHPTRNLEYLRLRDHGCELISGLCELYYAVSHSNSKKKDEYQAPLHEMLDRILEVGRNEHGMFYDAINPVTGEVISSHLSDTWGYTLNGYYTIFQIDGNKEYLEAIHKLFSNLAFYKNHDWEGNADGYADAIESALNLYNRIPDPAVANWIDSEIKVMWGMQQESGIIEGWHGDGNFARTSLMYQLWKTKGTYLKPWRKDLHLGVEQLGDSLFIQISGDSDWEGRLYYDKPRHREYLKIPSDYPRINQFPEWFTVGTNELIKLIDIQNNRIEQLDVNQLINGIPIDYNGGSVRLVAIKE
ncbi:hypothetical protein ACFLU5_03010 [Bacteroidota bacterium]